MKEKTLCFTGHRKIPPEELPMISEKLRHTLIDCIKKGYCYFGAGGALGFDTLAAKTVLELKRDYPHIKLILVLPCQNQTRGWKEKDIAVYEAIKDKADKVVYTAEHYFNGCMQKRNRHLVDCSSLCICYLTEQSGETFYTVNYAKECGIKVLNIRL